MAHFSSDGVQKSLVVPRNFRQYPKLFAGGGDCGMGTERDARAGGTTCRTGKYRIFLRLCPFLWVCLCLVVVLTPEQGRQIAGKYESHYWEGWQKCKIKITEQANI